MAKKRETVRRCFTVDVDTSAMLDELCKEVGLLPGALLSLMVRQIHRTSREFVEESLLKPDAGPSGQI